MVNRLYVGALGLFIYLVLLGPQVWAVTLDEARRLYEIGEFDQAIAAASAEGSPEGLILASETLAAKVMLGYSKNRRDSAKQARQWAESALESLPQSTEARLQYALAYAFETQVSSTMRVWRKKMPEKSKAAIDALQAVDPENPRGLALLGGWHLGIIQKAGTKNGKKWYGASEAGGIEAFENALRKSPDDQAIAIRYALALIAIDKSRHDAKAKSLLVKVKEAKAANAVEADITKQAELLLSHWDDHGALVSLAEDILDGKTGVLAAEK